MIWQTAELVEETSSDTRLPIEASARPRPRRASPSGLPPLKWLSVSDAKRSGGPAHSGGPPVNNDVGFTFVCWDMNSPRPSPAIGRPQGYEKTILLNYRGVQGAANQ